MKILKKLFPVITLFLFTVVFYLFQSITPLRITVPLIQESKPVNDPYVYMDYGCNDQAIPEIGFPFRVSRYDYCGDDGVILIPVILNLIIYVLLAYLVFLYALKISRK